MNTPPTADTYSFSDLLPALRWLLPRPSHASTEPVPPCPRLELGDALQSVIRMNHLELNLNVLHGTTPGSLAAPWAGSASGCAGAAAKCAISPADGALPYYSADSLLRKRLLEDSRSARIWPFP